MLSRKITELCQSKIDMLQQKDNRDFIKEKKLLYHNHIINSGEK